MKKYIYTFVLSFLLLGCQEVIDIDLEDGDARLIVDAYFEINNGDTSFLTSQTNGVKLSTAAPYFDTNIPTVSNALVSIKNLTDNSIINFEESNEPGFFIPVDGIIFQPDYNTTYELTVVYNNETYTSTAERIPTVPIDLIEQRDGMLFTGDEIELFVEFTDDGSRDDFYIFDLDFNLFVPTDDELYQGETFNFSYYYDDQMADEQDVTVKVMGVDEDYFNYFNLIIDQSEQDGSPFQTTPVLIKGNIVNTTNQDNYAFGYFRISDAYSLETTLIKKTED